MGVWRETRRAVTIPGAPPPPPPPPPGGKGIPFGCFNLWASDTSIEPVGTASFDLSLDFSSPGNIIARIDAAIAQGRKLVLAMTGGSHSQYTDANQFFQQALWQAKQDTFNATAIKNKVAAGVASVAAGGGGVIGASVLDEPNNATWNGGVQNGGWMTKAKIDALVTYAKGIFPTLPLGVVGTYTFDKSSHYAVADFFISQFTYVQGTPTFYRDQALAVAAADGCRVVFSMNIVNGGLRILNCPKPQTGGVGTRTPNCRMTGQQIEDAALILGPAGKGQLLWQYDLSMMSLASVQTAFANIKADFDTRANPGPSWLR